MQLKKIQINSAALGLNAGFYSGGGDVQEQPEGNVIEICRYMQTYADIYRYVQNMQEE